MNTLKLKIDALDDNNSKLFDTDAVGLNFSLLSEATGGVTASI